MPRLFMAVRREQRYPITEILAQTPVIDDACQWAIFLRNHDELTLEQVSDEERDYLIAEYAKDPRMKRHMGIGRRLAPLLDNDRRTAELLYALILSLPGSPVIYYGDELLMGDNIYLGDRDSVRTPMQWSPDRNGGFSQADFAQLYLPPLMDPVYGFSRAQRGGAAAQPGLVPALAAAHADRAPRPAGDGRRRDGGAAVRQPLGAGLRALGRGGRHPDRAATRRRGAPSGRRRQSSTARSTGAARPCWPGPSRRATRARATRSLHRHQAVLCVHNLSRFAQPAELALAKWAGSTPYEVLGRVPFPVISEEPYTITLPPYGFLWFDLVPEERPPEE